MPRLAGIHYRLHPVTPFQQVMVDDDLNFSLTKQLTGESRG